MSDQGAVRHWAEVDRLLDRVLALPPTDRAAFVEQQTTEDPRLREEVLALLADLRTRGDLLDRPAVDAISRRGPAEDLPPGHRIGAYQVSSLLGRGGMGEVYRAERADGQFEHRVALKLLRQDAVEHLGLFVSERRILATLEHPGIARLYDAGVCDDGRPYMVMELVDGMPITDWCRERQATLHERLGLFMQVCEAVAYAHQNLVIHRDLKPGNILVTADGRAKLLDFGVAKLLSGTVEEATRNTPLTLSYAAPEQLKQAAVSTATDIYALGVLLFELLTDRLPWLTGQLAIATAIDKVLHETAPAPGEVAGNVPSPPVPARLLTGDLDAIVAKALRKEPADRYATVAGLQVDVRRHEHGEPVVAREGARMYVFGRFMRRYRWGVAGVAALIVSLVAGLAGTAWQAQRAETEARTAEAVQQFMGDIFRANASTQEDPVKARDTTARQLLDLGAKKIDTEMHDAPAAKLNVLRLLSQLYDDLELDDEAVRLRRETVLLASSLHGTHSTETAGALIELATSMHASNVVNERKKVLDEAGAILDRNQDFNSVTRAALLRSLAEHYQSEDLPRALDYARQSVRLFEAKPASVDLAEAYYMRGVLEETTGLVREAAASFSRGIDVSRQAEGFPNPSLPRLYAYLGQAQTEMLDMAGAEKSARLALHTARAINGEDHVDTLQTGMRLGFFLVNTGRTREGLTFLQAAKQSALKIRGADDPFHTPQTLLEHGYAQARIGRLEEGLADMQAAITNRRANRPDTVYLATMLEYAASALLAVGRLDESRANLDEASAIRLKSGIEPRTLPFNFNTGMRIRLALATGQPELARALLGELFVDTEEGTSISLTSNEQSLFAAQIEQAAGRDSAATQLTQRVRSAIAKSGLGAYLQWHAMRADLIEGKATLHAGNPAAALPLLQRALATRKALLATSSPDIADAQVALADCYVALGQVKQAQALATDALAIHAEHKELGEQYRAPLRELQRRLSVAGKSKS